MVVSSPTGTAHYYHWHYGVARTLCGRRVPQHRGWFGPIDEPVTCSRCIAVHTHTPRLPSNAPRTAGGDPTKQP
jgi:hypothetical protein